MKFTFKIIELEAAAIPRSLDDLDCAAINTTYAMNAGLDPAKDPIVKETADSLYVNIVAVRKDTLKDPRLEQFRKIYQSKESFDYGFMFFRREHFQLRVLIKNLLKSFLAHLNHRTSLMFHKFHLSSVFF